MRQESSRAGLWARNRRSHARESVDAVEETPHPVESVARAELSNIRG
jgi:hypothetical protein